MEGRATPTIDTSSASRPTTVDTVSRTPHRRASHRVEVVDRCVEELMQSTLHAHASNARGLNSFASNSRACYLREVSDVAERGLVQQWHGLLARHAAVFGALESRLQ